MDETESLSSILGDSPFSTGDDPAPPAEAPKEETPETEPEQPETEVTQEAEPDKPEGKTEEKPALTKADVAAIIDERRKRQELERELQALKQQQQQPKADIFEDPEAVINQHLQARLAPLENTILKLQVELAKTKMPDFDDAAVAFFTAAQNDPVLLHQADTAPDQFAFIYREGKRLKELGDVGGDIEKYREKVTAEARAENAKLQQQLQAAMAELESVKKAQAELAAVPRSLSQEGTETPKASEVDPEDINQIVRFKTG